MEDRSDWTPQPVTNGSSGAHDDDPLEKLIRRLFGLEQELQMAREVFAIQSTRVNDRLSNIEFGMYNIGNLLISMNDRLK